VKIQEVIPDKKKDYSIIESVKFKDNDFIDFEIVLNSNLVSIIGSRSTGKSIFLRSIARAIDKNHVEEVCGDISNLINPDTIVKWKNGTEDKFENSSENKIIYIPQNFLNNQITEADPDSFSYKLINDILRSDKDYKSIFSRIDTHNYDFETKTHENITKLFKTEAELTDLKKQLKELGSPDDVKKEIEKLNKEYLDLQSKDDLDENDKKLQKVLIEELRILENNLILIKNDEFIINKSLEYLTPKKTFFEKDIIQDLSKLTKNNINTEISKADTIYKSSLINLFKENIDNFKKDVEKIKVEISSKEDDLETLNKKLNKSKLAEEIFSRIKEEEEVLFLIKDKKDKIEKIQKISEITLLNIFQDYTSFIGNLEYDKNSFLFPEEYDNFEAELSFKTKEFKNALESSLNKKKFSAFENKYSIDLFEFKYDESDFLKKLEIIIKAILDETLPTKGAKSKKNVIKELLGIYHFINFSIIEDGEKLENMSPGKRSFALLKVLIESDKSKWPIILDQPEDDLDANSISKGLSKFLKGKKKYRQIIIASHNPNLVVGADSEQIIIANQEGSDSKNRSKRFEYMSGSIENTYIDEEESCYLYCKGIKEHICDILEGGEESFKKRQNKYNIR